MYISLKNVCRITLSLTAIVWLYCGTVSAKELESYIRKALDTRQEIQIAKSQIELAKLRVLNAARILGPAINIEYAESEGKTLTDPYRSKSYGLRLEQSVFMGGKKFYTLKRELESSKVAQYEYDRKRQSVKYETYRAYNTALSLKIKLDNMRKLDKEVGSEYEMAEKKYKSGIITQIDFLEVKDIMEEIDLQKELLENELEYMKLELKRSIGLDFDEEINIKANTINMETSFLDLPLEKYKQIALDKRPDVLSHESLVKQSKYNDYVARSAKWPNVVLEGSVGKAGEAFVDRELELASEWTVFANLQWVFWGNTFGYRYGKRKTAPSEVLETTTRIESREKSIKMGVFDRVDYFYSQKEKEITRMQAQKDYDEIKKKAVLEVKKSYNSMVKSRDIIAIAKKKLALSEKKVKIVEQRKLLGEVTSKELISTKYKHVQEVNSLIDAIGKYNIAVSELRLSSGLDIHPVSRSSDYDPESE